MNWVDCDIATISAAFEPDEIQGDDDLAVVRRGEVFLAEVAVFLVLRHKARFQDIFHLGRIPFRVEAVFEVEIESNARVPGGSAAGEWSALEYVGMRLLQLEL